MKDKLRHIRIIPWLFRKVKYHIPAVILMAVLSMICSFLGVKFALISKAVVDVAVSGNHEMLWNVAVRLALIIIGMLICTQGQSILSERTNYKLDKSLKKEYLSYILNGDFTVASSFHSGDILNRLSGDVGNICRGLTSVLQALVSIVTSFVFTVAALSGISVRIMGVLVIAAAVMSTGLRLISKKFIALNKEVTKADSRLISFFNEAIGKLLIVQGLNLARVMEKKADDLLNDRYYKQRKKVFIGAGFSAGLSGLSYLTQFASLIWCAGKLAAGAISVGDLTAITQLATKLEAPFFSIPSLAAQFFSILASAERLSELESIPQDVSESKKIFEVPKVYNSMECISGEHINFCYGRKPIFEDFSFEVPKGKITVICGNSGIGKSTLLKMMLGLYSPKSGLLYIKTNNNNISLDRSTRSLFTYAPQGNLLISGSIRDNLILVKPDASEEEIQTAIYISAMDDFLGDFPHGVDTLLGENGTGISEGQAQRLSLARAWLTGAPVMLLDEITSSLDEETEKKILTRIKLARNITCIIVTHRKAVRDIADNVIML